MHLYSINNMGGPCIAAESKGVYEIQLQTAWCNVSRNKQFKTIKGQGVTVLSPGTWNVEAGPDFKNAKVAIEGKNIIGDIEVHYSASDWYHHGHDTDHAYDNVILHVVASCQGNEHNIPDIPTVLINPQKTKRTLAPAQMVKNGLCVNNFSLLDDASIHKLLVSAGLKRFEAKSEEIMKEMLQAGGDGTFLKLLFDALGYKENREAFHELYMRMISYSEEILCGKVDVILWGEAGLLPDPAAKDINPDFRALVSHCWKNWWAIRQEAKEPITWKRSSVRPLNSPERRLAALIALLAKISLKPIGRLSMLAEKNYETPMVFRDCVLKLLVTKDTVWDNYTNFFDMRKHPAAVLGTQRALDIMVNVVLPALSAYGKLNHNVRLSQFAQTVWLMLPKTQDNRIVKNAVHRWFMPPSRAKEVVLDAASAQGVLFLYKNFCEKNHTDCPECGLFNIKVER